MARYRVVWLRGLAVLTLIGVGVSLHAFLPKRPDSSVRVEGHFVRLTPDGSRIVTVQKARDGSNANVGPIRLWDSRTGELVQAFLTEDHTLARDEISTLLFHRISPTGSLLLFSNAVDRSKAWLVDWKSSQLRELKLPPGSRLGNISLDEWSFDDRLLMLSTDTPGAACILDSRTNRVFSVAHGENENEAISGECLGPDSTFLVQRKNAIHVHEIDSGKIRTFAEGEVTSMGSFGRSLEGDLSESRRLLATRQRIDNDHVRWRIRNIPSGEVRTEFIAKQAIVNLGRSRVTYSHDERFMLIEEPSMKTMELRSVDDGRPLWSVVVVPSDCTSLTSDGRQIFRLVWGAGGKASVLQCHDRTTGLLQWEHVDDPARTIETADEVGNMIVLHSSADAFGILGFPIASKILDRRDGRIHCPREIVGSFERFLKFSKSTGLFTNLLQREREPFDPILAWFGLARPGMYVEYSTKDLESGMTFAKWRLNEDWNVDVLDSGKISMVHRDGDEGRASIVEIWDPDPPYRWEWIVGVPLALGLLLAAYAWRRSMRTAARRLETQ